MKPQPCFLCAGARVAVLVHDGWPLCQRCADQADESAAERLYGSHASRTVAEPPRERA